MDNISSAESPRPIDAIVEPDKTSEEAAKEASRNNLDKMKASIPEAGEWFSPLGEGDNRAYVLKAPILTVDMGGVVVPTQLALMTVDGPMWATYDPRRYQPGEYSSRLRDLMSGLKRTSWERRTEADDGWEKSPGRNGYFSASEREPATLLIDGAVFSGVEFDSKARQDREGFLEPVRPADLYIFEHAIKKSKALVKPPTANPRETVQTAARLSSLI